MIYLKGNFIILVKLGNYNIISKQRMLKKDYKERIDIFIIDSELQEFSMDLFEGKYYQNKLNY